MSAISSVHVQALARVIRTGRRSIQPATIDGLAHAPASFRELLDALASHAGPVLGRFDLGLDTSDNARRLATRDSTPSYVSTEHCALIGACGGAVDLVLAWWGPRDGAPLGSLLVVDEEGGTEVTSLESWLHTFAIEHPGDATVARMNDVYADLEGVPVLDLPPSDTSIHHPPPANAAALKAGGHKFYLSRAGTSVSVHTHGLRFINHQGKRKTFNDKLIPKLRKPYAAISADGGRAWVLGPAALRWVDLPQGKPNGVIDVVCNGFALLDHERIIIRRDCEVALLRREGDAWREAAAVVSLALGPEGDVWPLFDGAAFLVTNGHWKQAGGWIGVVRDDDTLEMLGRVPGSIVAFPDITTPLLDGPDEVLVRLNSEVRVVRRSDIGL